MRARYVGQEAETTTFGKTFQQRKWVNADALGDHARAALAQNPQFETDGGETADPEPALEVDPLDPTL